MKLRARWEGALPEVGDALRGAGPRVRSAYAITHVHIVQRMSVRVLDDDGVCFSRVDSRVVFEVERVPAADVPPGVKVHAWTWDKRDRRPR